MLQQLTTGPISAVLGGATVAGALLRRARERRAQRVRHEREVLARPAWKRYPEPTRDSSVRKVYHGTTVVADPYRALEDPDAPETQAFVAAQNECSRAWFSEKCADVVPVFAEKMTELYNYEKFGTPFRRGAKDAPQLIFFFYNNGLQNQYVLKVHAAGSDPSTARVLLDPNTIREDGTAALRAYDVSPDGRYLAYGVSYGGSDWFTVLSRMSPRRPAGRKLMVSFQTSVEKGLYRLYSRATPA